MNRNSKRAKKMINNGERKDVYTRVTERIISDLGQGHPYVDEALDHRAHSGTHHQTATSHRHTVPGNEYSPTSCDRVGTNIAFLARLFTASSQRATVRSHGWLASGASSRFRLLSRILARTTDKPQPPNERSPPISNDWERTAVRTTQTLLMGTGP